MVKFRKLKMTFHIRNKRNINFKNTQAYQVTIWPLHRGMYTLTSKTTAGLKAKMILSCSPVL